MLSRTRLERLLAMLQRIARAAKPKPRNVLEVPDLDDAEAVNAAVAQRVAELDEHQVRGGLLIVPGMATPEEWDESAVSAAARASHNRPEHDSGRGKG